MLEIASLLAFGVVGLALRLVVVRLGRGRDEIGRVAAELGAMRTQVDEARESTERWVAQLEVAQRAAARMAGRPSVRAVAEAVADEIRAIVDYHACRVYVLQEPDDLVPVVAAGDNGYETIALEDLGLKVGEGFSGWVAANGRPLLVPDANADPRGVTIPGTDEIDESMVVVPMPTTTGSPGSSPSRSWACTSSTSPTCGSSRSWRTRRRRRSNRRARSAPRRPSRKTSAGSPT
jgi:hypothetical protein